MDQQVGKLIEPPPVAFHFGAPGWYVLGVLFLLLIVLVVWLSVRYYRHNLYRKHALRFLKSVEQQLFPAKEFGEVVYQTQMLIKRMAMSRYGRQNAAGLKGDQWITFINNTWREKSFDEADEKLVNANIYMPQQKVSADEATRFIEKSRRWIKKHKRTL
jgi:hypothetical protein